MMNIKEGQNKTQILLIGLDGGALPLTEKWIEQGYLPNLARLRSKGGLGALRSTVPAVSPAAWATFNSGKNPAKHGVYDFTTRDWSSYRMRLTPPSSQRAFWEILSEAGKKVMIINVPFTYPPHPVNGILITGMGTPRHSPFTFPPELAKELESEGYIIQAELDYRNGDEELLLKRIHEAADWTGKVSTRLLSQNEWDFAAVVFRLTDEVGHFFWKFMDPTHPEYTPNTPRHFRHAILHAYQKADKWVGELVELAPEAHVIVMSDHGMGALYQDVFLNEWLRQEGYLVLKESVDRRQHLTSLLQRIGITRTEIGHLLSKIGLGSIRRILAERWGEHIARVVPNTRQKQLSQSVDWSQTRAYSTGYIGQIYLNLQGRDPQGIVTPGEEADTLQEELRERLLAWRHPLDHQPIVDAVAFKDELYQGPYHHSAPDLVLTMRDLSYITRGEYDLADGELFTAPRTSESGSHRQDGILLVSGDGFAWPAESRIEIADLAPTILHMMGCAIPSDMDGRVRSDLFAEASPFTRAIITTDQFLDKHDDFELNQEEQEALRQRLEGLGYLA